MTNFTSRWDATDYERHGRFVADHATAVLELLAAQPGERILDLGCGDGAVALALADAGATVVGVDASPELVAAAQARGIDARVGDGAALTFTAEFDAVFSNAALHWMLDPDPVAAGMWRALRPGGRIAVEFGGFGNIAAIRTALHAVMSDHGFSHADPGQYYPTAAGYAAVLARAGFREVDAVIVPRQTLLPGHLADWIRTFRRGYLDAAGVPRDEQEAVVAETCELLEPVLHDAATGAWYADYVRLRVTARRP